MNVSNFTVCALKAGRNDRATPDGGYTYVDYIAFQGSPSGGVAGKETLANWWDGTTCKTASLPAVSSEFKRNYFNLGLCFFYKESVQGLVGVVMCCY